MSLGHFIFSPSPKSGFRAPYTPRLITRVRSNWLAMGKNVGLNNMLKARFLPGSLCHLFCCWPRPAYWLSAIMTVPSGNGLEFDGIFLRNVFVESTSLRMIKFCPTNNPEFVLFCKV